MVIKGSSRRRFPTVQLGGNVVNKRKKERKNKEYLMGREKEVRTPSVAIRLDQGRVLLSPEVVFLAFGLSG